MRHFLTATLFASAVVISLGASANAAPNTGRSDGVSNQSPIIQVDRRCGRHAHFVPRHRRHGHLVPGACVRDVR